MKAIIQLKDSLSFWGLRVSLSLTRLQVENVIFCETESTEKNNVLMIDYVSRKRPPRALKVKLKLCVNVCVRERKRCVCVGLNDQV